MDFAKVRTEKLPRGDTNSIGYCSCNWRNGKWWEIPMLFAHWVSMTHKLHRLDEWRMTVITIDIWTRHAMTVWMCDHPAGAKRRAVNIFESMDADNSGTISDKEIHFCAQNIAKCTLFLADNSGDTKILQKLLSLCSGDDTIPHEVSKKEFLAFFFKNVRTWF